jgi:hypothetical protein
MVSLQNKISNTDLAELESVINDKAFQSTVTADGVIEIDYDAELERATFLNSPCYGYLRTKVESSTNSYKVGYRVKEQKTDASFIAEGAEIPAHDPSIYTRKSQNMSTLVYPIEISDIAQEGTDIVDLMNDEITDGLNDINMRKDSAILQGDASADPNCFNGFTNLFTTNTVDLKKAQISLEDVDALAQSIIDEGGKPTAIFTTSGVARRLKDLIYAKTRYSYQVEQVLGFNVLAYVTPAGNQIPIIIDANLKGSASGDYLIMVDETTLRIKELMPPTVIDLAKTKLTSSKVIANYMTMYCRSEHKNGFLYNVNPKIE